jgi:methyl-accepting chemotaxis protein
VLLIFANSIIVFLSIQALDNNISIEHQRSDDLTAIQLFDQQLQNTLNIYNDSIYLNPYKFQVQARYNDDVNKALQVVIKNNSGQLDNQDSLISQINRDYKQLSTVFNQSNLFLQNGEAEKATLIWASSLELRRTIRANAQQLSQDLKIQEEAAAQSREFASTVALVSVLVSGILGALFAGLCAWLLSSSIGKPLASAYKFVERLSRGELGGQLNFNNRDELGELAKMLNRTVKTVAGLIESFNVGSEVETVARNLRQISGEQADYSIVQVQRVSEIDQSLYELTSTAVSINVSAASVAEAAANTFNQAQVVNQTSQEVSQTVQNLQLMVSHGTEAMEAVDQDFNYLSMQLQEVEQQSQNSQRVVEIIAQITQKIHILSINAAIEAAGAGIYGERFQVIAKQIKDLATHSAKSTEDIRVLLNLIRQSIQLTLQQSQKNQESVSLAMETSNNAEILANKTLQLSQNNQAAVGEIVKAAQNSALEAIQIKAAASQQETASQQIQLTVSAIGQEIGVSAQRSSQVANTSGELDIMSRTLASRLADLKFTPS